MALFGTSQSPSSRLMDAFLAQQGGGQQQGINMNQAMNQIGQQQDLRNRRMGDLGRRAFGGIRNRRGMSGNVIDPVTGIEPKRALPNNLGAWYDANPNVRRGEFDPTGRMTNWRSNVQNTTADLNLLGEQGLARLANEKIGLARRNLHQPPTTTTTPAPTPSKPSGSGYSIYDVFGDIENTINDLITAYNSDDGVVPPDQPPTITPTPDPWGDIGTGDDPWMTSLEGYPAGLGSDFQRADARAEPGPPMPTPMPTMEVDPREAPLGVDPVTGEPRVPGSTRDPHPNTPMPDSVWGGQQRGIEDLGKADPFDLIQNQMYDALTDIQVAPQHQRDAATRQIHHQTVMELLEGMDPESFLYQQIQEYYGMNKDNPGNPGNPQYKDDPFSVIQSFIQQPQGGIPTPVQ